MFPHAVVSTLNARFCHLLPICCNYNSVPNKHREGYPWLLARMTFCSFIVPELDIFIMWNYRSSVLELHR